MDVVVGIHAAAAVLLLIAGAAKIGRPQPTAELIAALGVPAPVLGGEGAGWYRGVVGRGRFGDRWYGTSCGNRCDLPDVRGRGGSFLVAGGIVLRLLRPPRHPRRRGCTWSETSASQ